MELRTKHGRFEIGQDKLNPDYICIQARDPRHLDALVNAHPLWLGGIRVFEVNGKGECRVRKIVFASLMNALAMEIDYAEL